MNKNKIIWITMHLPYKNNKDHFAMMHLKKKGLAQKVIVNNIKEILSLSGLLGDSKKD